MNKSNVSLRNRLLIWQYEYSDAAKIVAVFCAFALMRSTAIVRLELDPVTGTQRVVGVVEYFRPAPVNPKFTVGRGLYYTYDIRLEDDTLISIDDEVGTPHLVGSTIPIERQHHKHGADTYRLLNG